MTYPGGKGNCYQKLINMIPPHDIFISAFLGNCAVMRHKRPAARNIGVDADPAAIASFDDVGHIELICADALSFLRSFDYRSGRTFIYCDPPYLMSTRSSQRDLYRCEMATEAQHRELLTLVTSLPCAVMISGYQSDLYDEMLAGWNVISFEAITRGGTMATEYVWMNYPAPIALHDYTFLGDNFRERERIKRKKQRWVSRLSNMPRLERQALLSAIQEAQFTGVS